MHEPPYLVTQRLVLRLPEPEEANQVAQYYLQNREFLAPFSLRFPESYFTQEYWEQQLAENIDKWKNDRSLQLFIFERDAQSGQHTVITGTANFGGFMRRAAQFCYLGYGLTEANQGKGYMTEALERAIDYIFAEGNMHRIMANYVPHNQRSARVLNRLGFVIEGFARQYLYLNGRWEDHVMTSLTNSQWRADKP